MIETIDKRNKWRVSTLSPASLSGYAGLIRLAARPPYAELTGYMGLA